MTNEEGGGHQKNANTEITVQGRHGTHGLIHGRITNAILSAAYRVHGKCCPGLLERVYQTCVCHELGRMGIPFESEKPVPVIEDGIHIELGYRIDLLINFSGPRLREGIRRRVLGYEP
jgi:hypothetical protein